MNIYYEPVNVNQWNIFKKVSAIGHIEPFLAVKSMKIGDMVLLHVGTQNKAYDSGIYAYGKIIKEPYILKESPDDYCNNKNTFDVRIDFICYGKPIISHQEAKEFINQFRTVHKLENQHYKKILQKLNYLD